MYRNDNPGTARIEVFRLTDFFDENTVTFINRPPSGLIQSSVIPSAAPAPVNINLSLLVARWYSGAIPNNGIELRGVENNKNNIIGFRSTRFLDSIFWPALQVTWSKGTVSGTVFDQRSGPPPPLL